MQVVVRIQKAFPSRTSMSFWKFSLEHAFLIVYDLHVRNQMVMGHKAEPQTHILESQL